MQGLEEFVATFRLRTEFPPASAVLSYLKFERNTPPAYRLQAMLHDTADSSKQADDDCDFMQKLEEGRPPRRQRELNLAELPKDPKLINFEQASRNTHFKCGIELYRAWREANRSKAGKRPFTAEEDRELIARKQRYGENWEKICQYMERRSFEELYYEYQNRVNPSVTVGKWSARQSMMLIVLLEHYGARKWAQIAHKMVCKSELQVRERYCNIIDPSIGSHSWTRQMEATLIDVASHYNYSWNAISKLPAFMNKTDNCIWRKFRALMAKKSRQEIEAALPNTGKRDLIRRILKYKDTVDSRKKGRPNRGSHPRVPLSMRPNLDFIARLSPATPQPHPSSLRVPAVVQ